MGLTGRVLRASALARSIDLSLPSHRLAVTAAVAFAVGSAVVGSIRAPGPTVGGVAATALGYGGGAFLTWALAREVDPDHPRSARYALAAYVPMAFVGPPRLGALFALLLMLRIVIRSTGWSPRTPDLVVVVLAAGVAATSSPGLVVAGGLAWAVYADRRLDDRPSDPTSDLAIGATAAVAVAVTVASRAFLSGWRAPTWPEVLVLVLALGALTQLRATEVSAVADRTGEPVALHRLVHARRALAVVLVVAVLWAGGEAVPALTPALAALVGAAATVSSGRVAAR